MLVVIPVSESDSKLINDFASCLHYFGSYKHHEVLVVCRPSDALHGVRLFNHVKTAFENRANIHVFEDDGIRGWPQGPNHYWKQTILHLKDIKNTQGWLWMELDMTPLKNGWLDILEREYKKQNKPCLGWVQNTTTITSERTLVNIGKHLVGAAIYPPDIDVCCSIWKHVDKISTAFDVLCQWELVPNSHHTELFQHCFRTQNYKKYAPNYIKGEDHNNFPDGLSFDAPISEKAVLHHGCEDGSLARLLIQDNI
jgi:hypothetical protein